MGSTGSNEFTQLMRYLRNGLYDYTGFAYVSKLIELFAAAKFEIA